MKHLLLSISIFFVSFTALAQWVPSAFAEVVDDGYTYYGDSGQSGNADANGIAPADTGSSGGSYEMDSAYPNTNNGGSETIYDYNYTAGDVGGTDASGNSTDRSLSGDSSGKDLSGNSSTGDKRLLANPLKSKSIEEFILKIIDVLLVFALPIIVLYIMYAGYLFVTAQGDSGQISTARSALLWAVVGGVIVLGARVIVAVIQGTIQGFQ